MAGKSLMGFEKRGKSLKEIIKDTKSFLWAYVILLLAVLPWLIIYDKNEIQIFINQSHNKYLDIFFKYLTNLGQGYLILIVTIILLFFSLRKSMILATAGIITGGITQFCKKVWFKDAKRPAYHLDEINLNIIENFDIHYYHSFPSGHTSSIFCLCLCLAYFVKNIYLKIFLLIVAIMVGFSRVYLSQHYLVDIFVGSIVGAGSAILGIMIIEKLRTKRLDNTIISIIKQK